jgi:hypothetical protein
MAQSQPKDMESLPQTKVLPAGEDFAASEEELAVTHEGEFGTKRDLVCVWSESL